MKTTVSLGPFSNYFYDELYAISKTISYNIFFFLYFLYTCNFREMEIFSEYTL